MHRKAINRDARHYDLCTASPFASDCPLVTEFSSFSTIAIRYCVHCGVDYSREQLVKLAKAGRVAAQTPEAQARRAETKRRHDLALKDWSAASQPDWLTQEFYLQKIQPKLAEIPVRALASAIDVSLTYASDIRASRRRLHARHWQALAKLVGFSPCTKASQIDTNHESSDRASTK
jgi:hypothetical protein